jgi:endonuclease-3
MPEFKKLIAKLKSHYGAPAMPPAQGPFELVMWENACYLLPDERRAAVFEGLRKQAGLNAKAIMNADPDTLLALATMGGMRPKVRVFRWQEIARITLSQFGGDLDQILKLPYAQAKKALKQFPNIGDPGAEKILMYCGASPGLSPHQAKTGFPPRHAKNAQVADPGLPPRHAKSAYVGDPGLAGSPGLPLEWNGLRVLTRVGYGRAQKNYGAMYRSVQGALKGELPRKAEAVVQAHLLLRQHGKEICRDKAPQCYECPVKELCEYPVKRLKMFSQTVGS